MTVDETLIELIESFNEEVLEKRTSLMKNVALNENQGEGWLKFELIDFLSNRDIDIDFETEVAVENGNIDFRIEDNWIELKQILIGKQKRQTYYVSSYLTKSYIEGDIKKLIEKDNAYLLMLAVKNPCEKWEKGVENFNKNNTFCRLESLTKTEDFPEHCFLGLLKVDMLSP